MKRKETPPNRRARAAAEAVSPAQKLVARDASGVRARDLLMPGFLVRHWSVTAVDELKKNWMALDIFRASKAALIDRLRRVSVNRDAAVLAQLGSEHMFAFAEFFYAIHALDLAGPHDVMVLLDLHNAHVAALAKTQMAPQRLAGAIFRDTDLLRLEEIWRDIPGAFEQSTLARFLAPSMSEDTVYMLVIACEAAGFLSRTATVCNAVVVSSTGVMEDVMSRCLDEMRVALSAL